MGQQQQRPFVPSDPSEWEVVDPNDYEVVSDAPLKKDRTWSDRLGLNEGTASVPLGFARGAGAGLVDLLQGASAKMVNSLAVDESGGLNPVTPAPTPETFSGKVGSMLPDAAMMAVPADAAANAIPRASRASKGFQEVMGAARNVVVDISKPGDVAMRISQLAERGGSMPMAVRKFINYATDPNKPQMTYEVSRDFASNISRLSVNEYQRMTPVVAKEVAQLRVALNEANAMAAKAAGKGAEYKAAMAEYAKAMKVQDAVQEAWQQAKRAALPVGMGAGAVYWMTRKLKGLLTGDQ